MDEVETTIDIHGHPVRVRGYGELDVARGFMPDAVPFNDVVGVRFDLLSPDRVEAHVDVGDQHKQPFGLVHGAVYCTLVEAVGSTGAMARVVMDGKVAVGVSNSTSFLRSTRDGRLSAVGTPVHVGRTQHLWQVDISRDDGSLVARGELRAQIVTPQGG